MAIKIDISTSQFGVPFSGAYFRIANVTITRSTFQSDLKHGVVIDVVGYATQPQDDNARDIEFRRYHAPLAEIEAQAGATFLNKCYDWVEQPDMFGSVGV